MDPNAQAVHDYFIPKTRLPLHTFSLMGSIEGECSFQIGAVGDHGSAVGIAQWHSARRRAIFAGTGIDVATAGINDQCAAMLWEMQHGTYRKVWPALNATDTIWSAITVLVQNYEQSSEQSRDIHRRVGLALNWQKTFEVPDAAPSA